MKKLFYISLILIISIIVLIFAFVLKVKINDPISETPTKYQHLGLDFKNDTLKLIGKNWLKKNKFGLYELYVEGKDFERGYINGLLTSDLIEKQEIAFKNQIDELIPSEFYQSFLKYFIAWFNSDLEKQISDEYKREIFGVSKSFSNKYDNLGPAYQRVLNYHGAHDIGHMMQNMNWVACSAFATWNNKSKDNSLIIGRNFDFYVGDKFAEDKIVCFINPDKGHKFMMITWGGMVGVTSGMNTEGLTISLNSSKSEIPTSTATPVSIIAREILQYASTIEEAYTIAKKHKSFVSESFMIGSAKDHKCVIIEKTTTKTELFSTTNSQIECTNHFQSEAFINNPLNIESRDSSASLYRINRLKELIYENLPLNENKAAKILRDTKGLKNKDIGLGNECCLNQLIAHHSVIFKPEKLEVWVSSNPYQLGEYVYYNLNTVFNTNSIYKFTISDNSKNFPKDSLIYSKTYKEAIEHRNIMRKALKDNFRNKLTEEEIFKLKTYNPEYFEGYYILGRYYQSQNDDVNAIKYYNIALTKHVNKPTTVTEIKSIILKLNSRK